MLPDRSNIARDMGLWGIGGAIGTFFGPVITGPLLAYIGRKPQPAATARGPVLGLSYARQGYIFLFGLGAAFFVCSAALVSLVRVDRAPRGEHRPPDSAASPPTAVLGASRPQTATI